MHSAAGLARRLWIDDAGSTLSSELILIMTILGIGMIAGLTTIRDQVTFELADIATAFGQINQSYSFGAVVGNGFSFAASSFNDQPDYCDDTTSSQANPADAGTACVVIVDAASE